MSGLIANGPLDRTVMQRDDMEEAFAQWGSERGYNVNLCDREAFEAAWNIAYAIGRRDADADWTDDVAEVEARLKADDARRAKNAKHNLGTGTEATSKADANNEGRNAESLPDAEEPGMEKEAEVEAEVMHNGGVNRRPQGVRVGRNVMPQRTEEP